MARRQGRVRSVADLLFSQGFGSRRDCEALVGAGRVRVQGQAADAPEAAAPDAVTEIEVDGTLWPVRATATVLLHKPAGFECSAAPRDHPSVLSLLPAPLRRRGVQPVGRLDADTTGALLLTDDGALLHRLTSPRHHVPKVYEVTLRHALAPDAVPRLLAGVVLHDDPQPVRAAAAEATGTHTLRLTLTEGRYHQVKRMLAAVGNRVEALHRSAFGPLRLGEDLPARAWRWLDEDEARALSTGARSAQ